MIVMMCPLCHNYFQVGSAKFRKLSVGLNILHVCPECFAKETGVKL